MARGSLNYSGIWGNVLTLPILVGAIHMVTQSLAAIEQFLMTHAVIIVVVGLVLWGITALLITRQPENVLEKKPKKWSSELLRSLEWKRFEEVAAEYLRLLGYRSKTTRVGADGGIDIVIYGDASGEPIGLVQCKAWSARPVGIKPVRELLGVMTHENVVLGIFLTTSTYTEEARRFAKAHALQLIDGKQLLAEIRALDPAKQQELMEKATDGDYTTPTCPHCDIKMVERKGRDNSRFWGCPNFGPHKCRQTFRISS